MRVLVDFFIVAGCCSCLCESLVAQEKSDAESNAIHALDRAFLPNSSVRLKVQSVTYRKESKQETEVRNATLDTDLMRDGNRWWVCGKRMAVRIEEDGPKEYEGEFEHLIADDQLVDLTWQESKKQGPHIFSATFNRSALANKSRAVALSGGPFLFGLSFSQLDKTLAEELTAAQTQRRTSFKQLGEETILEARDANGHLSIILSPHVGVLLPTRLDFVKGPSDLLGGKKVGDLSGGSESPSGKMLAYERHITAVWSGQPPSLTSYEDRIVRKFTGGDVQERTVNTILNRRSLTKEDLSKFVITSAIPSGTPVNIRER